MSTFTIPLAGEQAAGVVLMRATLLIAMLVWPVAIASWWDRQAPRAAVR